MSRWRIAVVAALVILPVVVLASLGSYWLWSNGLSLIVWWPMMLCAALGYLLAARWLHRRALLPPVDCTPPEVSTQRDKLAWEIVARRASASGIPADQLITSDHYGRTAQDLARELAAHYYPDDDDPLAALTLPEILAVIELVCRDLVELVTRSVPGIHLLTLRDVRRAKAAYDWYQSANKLWLAVSAVIAPINTGARILASHIGITMPMQAMRENLLGWFHGAFVQRLGYYLIELYSGRLRVGAARWRELVEGKKDGPRLVSLAVAGQAKAGKSSLVNALLGDQKANTDVLPTTDDVTRYHVAAPGLGAELVIADTPGYGVEGPRADQLERTAEAARQADVLILVLHARNPGRRADVALLDGLRQWFAQRPDLRPPLILGVLTHIDLLSPAMEWQPPYDPTEGQRPKEVAIRDALAAVQEQIGDAVDGIVPACTAEGKLYGINEYLFPALAARLDEARVVNILRCLRREADVGKVGKVFGQLAEAGKGLLHGLRRKKV